MAYADDVRSVKQLEKYRLVALIVAATLLVLDLTTDLPLAWPRALTWAAAGVVTVLEARAQKRLGRSPDYSYLRAALFLVVAVVCIV